MLSEIDNRSAYQRYVQSGLFYNDGCLYYNTESQIIKYDLLNNTKYPVYELDPAMGYVRGCRLNGNVVEFSVYNSTSKGSTTYELVSEDGWKNLENGWYYIKNQKILKSFSGWKMVVLPIIWMCREGVWKIQFGTPKNRE